MQMGITPVCTIWKEYFIMPRLTQARRKYCRHRQSDRGRVRVDGRGILLPGKFNSKTNACDRVVGAWLRKGRSFPPDPAQPITVAEVMPACIRHAGTRCVKAGKSTSEHGLILAALSHLPPLCGKTAVRRVRAT